MSLKVTIQTPDDTARDDGRVAADAPLKEKVIHALKGVMDPELPVNLYDLGLIYELDVADGGVVRIVMTLTAPNCPVAEEMPGMVQRAVMAVDGVKNCDVKLVFEPPWDKSRLSEAAKLELGLF